MASLMVERFSKVLGYVGNKTSLCYTIVRHSSKRPKIKEKRGTIKHRNLIASCCESLSARGFLRSYKPYTPPPNAAEKVTEICRTVLGTSYDPNSTLLREDKFHILNACFKELSHSVPNSVLYKIINVTDVIKFYETPVSTTVPYDEFKNKDLPPNLHIQYDYIRFDPDTATPFKGITAFPRSATIITGLRHKEKYKGYVPPPPNY